jgi:hypothetical protein
VILFGMCRLAPCVERDTSGKLEREDDGVERESEELDVFCGG